MVGGMEDFVFLFVLLVVMAISGMIGSSLGKPKGNESVGGLLGAFFGPLGWVLAAVMEDKRQKLPGVPVKRERAEYKKPDPIKEFEARERAKKVLEVPDHLRGRKVDED